MKPYLDLVRDVLFGEPRADRTGVGTLSVFGTQTRYDLREGFPLLTTKKVLFSSVVKELLWFLRGETNRNTLGCGIWDEWAGPTGELGPIYGHQWRKVGGDYDHIDGVGHTGGAHPVDQIQRLIAGLVTDPLSRRHIVSAWNVEDLDKMALLPCHVLFQCYVSSDLKYLDLHMYQRSADLALGVPFNIASYALLMHILGTITGYTPRYLIHSIGDAHVYRNHVRGLLVQLQRDPLTPPTLRVERKLDDPGNYTEADFTLLNYEHHPFIKFEVAV